MAFASIVGRRVVRKKTVVSRLLNSCSLNVKKISVSEHFAEKHQNLMLGVAIEIRINDNISLYIIKSNWIHHKLSESTKFLSDISNLSSVASTLPEILKKRKFLTTHFEVNALSFKYHFSFVMEIFVQREKYIRHQKIFKRALSK